MRKTKQTERPFIIRYISGDRCLYDSASTLDMAKARAEIRVSKNTNERAEVYRIDELVFQAGRLSVAKAGAA